MAAKIYFRDALTGEELGHPCQGWFPGATDSNAFGARGDQYTDTTWGVTVTRAPYGARATQRTITAEDFPGRLVIARDWSPGGRVEERLLVSEVMGFRRTGTFGGGARILRDHKALAWIARRITSRVAA